MSYMNDNEWVKFLKSKVEEFEFPYDDKYWEQLQKQLPQKHKKNNSFWFWGMGILALILLFITLGYHFYKPEHKINIVQKAGSLKTFENITYENPFEDNKTAHKKQQITNQKIKNQKVENYYYTIKNKFSNNTQKNHIQFNSEPNKRKRSAQLQILSEKVSAISRTILIYKALKKEAQNYIPIKNADELNKKLEWINTKNLIALESKQELIFINKELQKNQKKNYFEKNWSFGLGGGVFGSKYTQKEDLYFRQWISSFMQYPFGPLLFAQTLPQISYGSHLSLNNKKSQPLAFHFPLETGLQWNRQSFAAGFVYEYFFLNEEQKQELKTTRSQLSISFQSHYQQFMLRMNAQYALNNISKLEAKHQEFRFSVGLYYIFLSK